MANDDFLKNLEDMLNSPSENEPPKVETQNSTTPPPKPKRKLVADKVKNDMDKIASLAGVSRAMLTGDDAVTVEQHMVNNWNAIKGDFDATIKSLAEAVMNWERTTASMITDGEWLDSKTVEGGLEPSEIQHLTMVACMIKFSAIQDRLAEFHYNMHEAAMELGEDAPQSFKDAFKAMYDSDSTLIRQSDIDLIKLIK